MPLQSRRRSRSYRRSCPLAHRLFSTSSPSPQNAEVNGLTRALLTHGSRSFSIHAEHVRVELRLYRIHVELLNRANDGVPCADDNVHTPRLLQDYLERLRDLTSGSMVSTMEASTPPSATAASRGARFSENTTRTPAKTWKPLFPTRRKDSTRCAEFVPVTTATRGCSATRC